MHPNTRYNTDLIVDIENAGGRGISQALGLAGETNLDVVRNPNLSTAPYLSRGEIHQIIGLTDEMTDQERGPFALATKMPVRRFEIRVGKMSLPDTFDVNSVGSDSHLAVHQLDHRQQRRMGLRCRHARLHRGRNSGVRRPRLVGALRHRGHADGRQRHRPRLGLQPRQRAELGVRIAQRAVRAAAESKARGRGARA